MKKSLKSSLSKLDPWLSPVIIGFIAIAWASWGKLVELIWDTGHEVEIPARMLRGEILYRDIESYYGPLTYYINALGLLVFGHHLEVFYVIGLLLAAIAILLTYNLAKRLTNAPWAALCAGYIIIYCAFRPGGLWNFIVPYSYGIVYATILCLIAFTTLDRYGSTGKVKWLAVAAIATGLAGLAKQEFGVAGTLSLLVGANLYAPRNLGTIVKRSAFIVFIASACASIPLALLAQQASWEKVYTSLLPLSKSKVLTESGLFDVSWAKTLFEWNYTFRNFVAASGAIAIATIAGSWISRQVSLSNKSAEIALDFGASLALSAIALALLQESSGQKSGLFLAATLLIVLAVAIVLRWMDKANSTAKIISLQSIFKFIVVSIFLGLSLWFLRRLSCCSISVFHPISNMAWLLPALVIWFALRWPYLVRSKYAPLLWTFLVFSLLINARFLFYINFYGLYAVTAVILLFALLYQLARETGLVIAKYLLICLLIGASFNLNEFANYRYPVRSAQGVAYTKDEDLAMAFNRTLEVIDSSKANSVLVIPEGSILNFLSQTRTPSRETIFIPGVLPTPDAQIDFLKRMEADLPDLIVYVDVPFFWLKPGYQSYREYNSLVHQWIVRQYRLIHSSKPLDYHGNPWTIRIYGRN